MTTVVLLIAPVATASAGFDPVLVNATVVTPDGSQTESVTLSQLEDWPAYNGGATTTMDQYTSANSFSSADLPGTNAPDQGTWPLSSVLSSISLPVAAVSSVVVYTDDNSPETQLTPDDLETPSDFEKPTETPVLAVSGSIENYYRPHRTGGDANALDHVGDNEIESANSDEPINIQVNSSGLLVTIIPPSPVTAGQPASFQATSSAPSGDSMQYGWSVDGQPAGEDTDGSQMLTLGAGSSHVNVTVTDLSTGRTGGAETTVNVMSSASQSATTTTQNSTSTVPVGGSGTAGSGPSQSTGTTLGASAGTQSTPGAIQSPTAAHTGPTSAGASPHATTTASTTTASKTKTSTTSTTSSSTTTTPRAGAGGGSSGSGSTPGTGAAGSGTPGRSSAPGSGTPHTAAASAATTAAKQHRVTPGPDPSATRARTASSSKVISGLLISGVESTAGGHDAGTTRAGAAAHAPALAPTSRTSLLTGFAAVAGALLLLGLGVGRELRGGRFVSHRTRPHTA